jgi:hypothetical protein
MEQLLVVLPAGLVTSGGAPDVSIDVIKPII